MKSSGCVSRAHGLRLCLVLIFAFSALAGCVERVPLQPQDVAGYLWLRKAHDRQTEGFFAGSEGQLLIIDKPALSGVTWSLQNDRLILELHDGETGETLTRVLSPTLDGRTLLLVPEEGQAADGFARSDLREPLSGKRYRPIYLAGATAGDAPQGPETVYLQFSPEESALHGFGGVNNFHGLYSRQGPTGFKSGPLASTMMSGPGMDYEMRLLQSLDRIDNFLAVGDELLLFEDKTLLISLRLL